MKSLPNGLDRQLKRIIALSDALELTDAGDVRDVLSRLGIAVITRVDGDRIVSAASIGGKETFLRSRPVPTQNSMLFGPREGDDQPDGGAPASPRFDPQTLEEAEEYADAQMAAAEALEDEWLATEADIQEWLNSSVQEGQCSTEAENDVPDGSTFAVESEETADDCVSKAMNALVAAAGSVIAIDNYKQAINTAISTLRALVGGYQGAYAAGTITLAAMENMIGGALVDFVVGLNVGWIATAVLVGGAAYFVWEWADCYFEIFGPDPFEGSLTSVGTW